MPLTDDRTARSHDATSGYTARVYVARRPSDEAVKIGATSNVRARIRTLTSTEGEEIELLGTFAGGYRVEAFLHRRHAADRIGETEWYRPARDLIRDLVELVD